VISILRELLEYRRPVTIITEIGVTAQHFLLSAAARTLTLASVTRMSDEEAERVFIRLRWADNAGNAYCPHCGCTTVYMRS
jgi:Transposase zinc-ribbon domain